MIVIKHIGVGIGQLRVIARTVGRSIKCGHYELSENGIDSAKWW